MPITEMLSSDLMAAGDTRLPQASMGLSMGLPFGGLLLAGRCRLWMLCWAEQHAGLG